MSNILRNKLTQERDINLEKIYLKLVIGASGAVTSYAGEGISLVEKETADGQYTVTFSDAGAYESFIYANFIQLDAAEDITFQVISEDVDSSTAPVVVFNSKQPEQQPTRLRAQSSTVSLYSSEKRFNRWLTDG